MPMNTTSPGGFWSRAIAIASSNSRGFIPGLATHENLFRVQGLGFRVWGLGFGVWDLGFGA